MTTPVVAIDPGTYVRHAIHADGRTWVETNCYVDLWIELLHALGHEPVRALPFTFAIDFEGDQWTFFKFPLRDLYTLFGVDVQELAIWRPLVRHIDEQVARGRPVLVELDSFFLPDTAGAAYRCEHVKSTVAVTEIDIDGATLGYFHSQGFFRLHGDDFREVLHIGDENPSRLPPMAEFVKISEQAGRTPPVLADSLDLLSHHLKRVPCENPFVRFRARLAEDLPRLLGDQMGAFHQYSFATLRQCGACYELSATYLRWLVTQGEHGLDDQIGAFQGLADTAKTLQFQLARAVARRRALDLSPLDEMAASWGQATAALQARYQ